MTSEPGEPIEAEIGVTVLAVVEGFLAVVFPLRNGCGAATATTRARPQAVHSLGPN